MLIQLPYSNYLIWQLDLDDCGDPLGTLGVRKSVAFAGPRRMVVKLTSSASEVEEAFVLYRLEGCIALHRATTIVILVWLAIMILGYRSELLLVGTLWPHVFKIKMTFYLTVGILHSILFFTFREKEARYVFGSLGSLHVDSAHQLLCLLVAFGTAFDDHRLVRLLDRNESYASQMAASFALTPERELPICGGYSRDGRCYLNSLEVTNLVLLLGHISGMGFGFSMEPSAFWRVMHLACGWYALCVWTLGHVYTSTSLNLANAALLYGILNIEYVALRRQHVVLRRGFELLLARHRQELAAAEERVSRAVDEANATEDRVQHEIAGYVFHELRNNINAMLYMLECVDDDLGTGRATLPRATIADLQDSRIHAAHAAQVISNVLDFTKARRRTSNQTPSHQTPDT